MSNSCLYPILIVKLTLTYLPKLPITALREIRLLKALRHQNVVPVLDIAYDPGDMVSYKRGETFMVFPYMDHDLAGLLNNRHVNLTMEICKLYAKQLLEGTFYLHKVFFFALDLFLNLSNKSTFI